MKRKRGWLARPNAPSRLCYLQRISAGGRVTTRSDKPERNENGSEEDGRDTNVQNRFWKGEGGPGLTPREG
jgi:hypothetical protein